MPALAVAAMVAELIVLVVFGVLLLGALREIGILRLRLGEHPGGLITDDGLPLGTSVPNVSLAPLDGTVPVPLMNFDRRQIVAAFLGPNCQSCAELVPHLDEIAATHTDHRVVPILLSSPQEALGFIGKYRLKTRAFLMDFSDATKIFNIPATPFIYILDDTGKVQNRGVANEWLGLESLMHLEGTLQAHRPWSETPDTAESK